MSTIQKYSYGIVLRLLSFQDKLNGLFLSKSRHHLTAILLEAGIEFNGSNPWDIKVNDERLYDINTSDLVLHFGEAYMRGWWDCEQLEELTYRLLKYAKSAHDLPLATKLMFFIKFNTFNLQTKDRSLDVAVTHYNVGNEIFASFLDPTMSYSCGYWRNADSSEKAQLDKLDLIAKKLKLKPGMKVLDIGCGWGGLCKYLAENYSVEVVGYTISEEQVKYAREYCKGLKVDIHLKDYRDISGKFDRIVSVGMFEHVGQRNYRTFFEVASRCLTENGLFLLHTIGVNHMGHNNSFGTWVDKYIFPNGRLPFFHEIVQASNGLFIVEDWHNFGYDYFKTLMAWQKNFEENYKNLSMKYDESFYKMWRFYLLTCAGLFKARRGQLWQIVLTKDGMESGYESVR